MEADLREQIWRRVFEFLPVDQLPQAGQVCKMWYRLAKLQWGSLKTLHISQLFETNKLPNAKVLNRVLEYTLKRCGRKLSFLDLTDVGSDSNGLCKVNYNTFKIIGRHCHRLEAISFRNVKLQNEHLHSLVRDVNCSKLKVLDLNGSFHHYGIINDGLTRLYDACPNLIHLDVSHTLNARVRYCREPWPAKLNRVHLDNVWALSNYSLSSLARCCPQLSAFSMDGQLGGLDEGLAALLGTCQQLRELSLRDYAGQPCVARGVSELTALRRLRISCSEICCDAVLQAVAKNCPDLQELELDSKQQSYEFSRYGVLSDEALENLANCKKLRVLSIKFRHKVTDSGLSKLLAKGRLWKLDISGCRGIGSASVKVLAENCARLHWLAVSLTPNIASDDIVHLCQNWLESNRQRSKTLEIHADDFYIDFATLKKQFKLGTNTNLHELRGCDENNEAKIQLFSDVLLSAMHS